MPVRARVLSRGALLAVLALTPPALPAATAVARDLVEPRPAVTDAPVPGSSQEVLTPAAPDAGVVPTPVGLALVLAPLLKDKDLGRSLGLSVTDAATGEPLFTQGGTTPLTPASVTKLLTGAAVLAALGPDARLHTRVVRQPGPGAATAAPTSSAPPSEPTASGAATEPGSTASATSTSTATPTPGTGGPAETPQIVLVGGGDPSLSSLPSTSTKLPDYPLRPHLDALADRTAAALRAEGVTRVRLRYDSSVFSGRTSAKEWPSTYTSSGVVGPVMGLSADQARISPTAGGRVDDPAARTAAYFATLLTARGIGLVGARTEVTTSPLATAVADVESAPMSALVEFMLTYSDNDFAEALARQVAVARGMAGTFENAAAAVRAAVGELGVPVDAVTTFDGSGLARKSRIPPVVLAQVLGIAATGRNTALRPLVAGLPIAGLTGTLAEHFYDPRSVSAAGLLRAKSGSLQGVVSLAGVVPDASGRLLAFGMIADAVKPGASLAARIAIERVGAALLACGCT
jgi:D-alanyl-D-alanine carboxypeptidase/D-alanyl-D-alanine-endopeptidase (penicillin-binding protein 4)